MPITYRDGVVVVEQGSQAIFACTEHDQPIRDRQVIDASLRSPTVSSLKFLANGRNCFVVIDYSVHLVMMTRFRPTGHSVLDR